MTPTLVQLAAGQAVVEFDHHRDRRRHHIRMPDGSVWSSIEGVPGLDDDPRWPRSPVLTEVSLQEVAGRRAIFGVGLAGRSHFSLCVTVHPELENTFLFEAACRIHSPAACLGSTYRAADGRTVRIEPPPPFTAPPATVCWTYRVGPSGILALSPAVIPAQGE